MSRDRVALRIAEDALRAAEARAALQARVEAALLVFALTFALAVLALVAVATMGAG